MVYHDTVYSKKYTVRVKTSIRTFRFKNPFIKRDKTHHTLSISSIRQSIYKYKLIKCGFVPKIIYLYFIL